MKISLSFYRESFYHSCLQRGTQIH
uniref:Uncharacterized protein n=1 Tax=Lepeophtheirus salmonis TaxID=72036 RepID=A0A0K2TH09_LEPSM